MNVRFVKISLFLLIAIVAYGVWQWTFLKFTEQAPFCNLLNEEKGNCLIYFRIKHQQKSYVVLCEYYTAKHRVLSGGWKNIAPFYLNEVINYDLSIPVSDAVFNELEEMDVFVDESLVDTYTNSQLNESILVDERTISKAISWPQRKAIIYRILRRGTNCCVADESGDVVIDVSLE